MSDLISHHLASTVWALIIGTPVQGSLQETNLKVLYILEILINIVMAPEQTFSNIRLPCWKILVASMMPESRFSPDFEFFGFYFSTMTSNTQRIDPDWNFSRLPRSLQREFKQANGFIMEYHRSTKCSGVRMVIQ